MKIKINVFTSNLPRAISLQSLVEAIAKPDSFDDKTRSVVNAINLANSKYIVLALQKFDLIDKNLVHLLI